MVNPNINKDVTMTVNFRSGDNSTYHFASKSFDSEPVFDASAKTVTVPANCYAVVTTRNISGVEHAVADSLDATRIFPVSGAVRVVNCAGAVDIYTIDGVRVAGDYGDCTLDVVPGTYVVRAAGKTAKVVVR